MNVSPDKLTKMQNKKKEVKLVRKTSDSIANRVFH